MPSTNISRPMKTVIIICTPFGLENNIPDIKGEIVKYIGVRLIKDNPSNAPLIELNSQLDEIDKLQISKITSDILETAALFFIEAQDDKFGDSGNYCTLQPKFLDI